MDIFKQRSIYFYFQIIYINVHLEIKSSSVLLKRPPYYQLAQPQVQDHVLSERIHVFNDCGLRMVK